MVSSPEIGPPPESKPMGSPPPFPSAPPPQENPQPTTADPMDPAQSNHAKSTPPPHPVNATSTSPEAYESPALALAPTDGTSGEAGRPPLLSASPALEATEPEGPTSPLPPPPVEACPEASTTEASPTPSPSTQIVAAPAAGTPPPSTTSGPPASPPGAMPDASPADSAAMVSKDAAQLPAALESMDAVRPTAPTPPKPPLKTGPDGLLLQQHLRPPCPTTLPGCQNSLPAQPPSPRRPLADIAHALTDTSETEPGASSACKSDAEESFELPMPIPLSFPTEAEPGSPEIAPPGFEKFKSSWPPLPSPNPLVKTTHSLLNAATPEEASSSPTVLEVMDAKINTAPGLPPPSSGSLQQPLLRPPSPITLAEPCSPDTPPPGFEDFKLSRLPPPIETTYTSSNLISTEPETLKHEEAVLPVPALEAIYMETDSARNFLPALESKVEGSVKQPLLRSTTPVALSEPCSLEMASPGFENFGSSRQRLSTPLSVTAHVMPDEAAMEPLAVKLEEAAGPSWQRLPTCLSVTAHIMPEAAAMEPLAVKLEEAAGPSWQRLSTPLSVTAHIMPDAAAMEPLAVKLEEAAGPRPAFAAMDVDMHAIHPLLVPLESGMEGSLQEPQPRPPSPTVQDVPCSPDMAPPGFENFKSPRVLLPSPPLAQTLDTFNDPATTKAERPSEEAAQPPSAPEAMDVKMETSLRSGAEGSLPQQLHQLPSPQDKSTASSVEMVPSGPENLQLLPLPPLLPEVQPPDVAVTESVIGALDQVHHPVPVLGTIEEGTPPILSPPLESGYEGLLPQVEPQVNSVTSLTTDAVDTQSDAPSTNYMDFKSDETALPPRALQAMDTNMDSATTTLLLSGNGAEGSLPQRQHQPSSPSMQVTPCSLDDLELLPPPPPPFLNKEMGQMVCGSCRELLAYPRGAVHVQCAGCRTINLVLEAHEVGNVRCGRCKTLLMYPFGAPAVKCSWCLFVTEIGERNVRPRISVEQVASPHPPELVNKG